MHTPGPWAYFVGNANGRGLIRIEVDCDAIGAGMHIASMPRGEISEANAALIATAPELLDALKDMLSGWKYIRASHGDLYGVGWDRAQEKAEAAISKALGQ